MSTHPDPLPISSPPKPDEEESRIDEAEDESFPASDPNSETQPRPTPLKK
jgi:L-lactate dehydrogenase complex protein LldG